MVSARILLPILPLIALSACGGGKQDAAKNDGDPEVAAAVHDPIMADPDLTGQSRNDTALSGGEPPSAGLPPFKRSQDEIDAAREAAEQANGGPIPAAPAPSASDAAAPFAAGDTAAGIAASLPALRPCARQLSYSAAWAARLPQALPVYPRAHVQQVAGSDAAGCKLRVVGFVTPVAVQDVVDFYHARARAIALAPLHVQRGSDEVVQGSRSGASFALYVRKRPDGLTEADLITAGL